MNAKKQVLATLSVLLIIFSSCKKDLIVSQEPTLQTAAVTSDAISVNDVVETAYPIHTPITTTINGNCAGYYETLPARYKLTSKYYPLIIFIHGIGELGTGVTRLNCCGVPYWAKRNLLPPTYTVNGVKYSPIYVSPQFRKRPSPSDVQAVINYAVKKYRVDPSRIYVTGLSMGGGSTYDYSVVNGQNVTAIAPVCGGTKPNTSIASSLASKNIPIWGIYSTGDVVVPISWGSNWINWLKADNPSNAGNIKLTVYSGLSHNATWGRAFNPTSRTDGFNIYEWLLRFKKGSTPAPGPVPAPTPTPTPAPSPAPTPTPTPTSGNKAPIANAGVDQTISLYSRTNALLNGPASKDPDGWLTNYTWTKVSGPSVTLVRLSLTSAHANNLVVGTYVFRLTVIDNKGATGYDDVKVVVTK
jgi:hypothetical protein